MSAVLKTALHSFHQKHNATMVNYANHLLPLIYSNQSHTQSHVHTRTHCSLFDVSHMCQLNIHGSVEDKSKYWNRLIPTNTDKLTSGRMVYSVMMNESGGIIDDCIVTKGFKSDSIVVNASCRAKDIDWMNRVNTGGIEIEELTDKSLLALQGPSSQRVLEESLGFPLGTLSKLYFMNSIQILYKSIPITIYRCGYTGEDGFELSIDSIHSTDIASLLHSHPLVELAGLAVRDSLRIESGLCLYGNELDESISLISAGLGWVWSNNKFIGVDRVISENVGGVDSVRVGIIGKGGKSGIPRSGSSISVDGRIIGRVTSGIVSPSLGVNVAMGYVECGISGSVQMSVRGKNVTGEIVTLPFVANKYYTKSRAVKNDQQRSCTGN